MTVEFDAGVLSPDPGRRREVLRWLTAALSAVDPEQLTTNALQDRDRGPTVAIAIGKAAPAMARGAAATLDLAGGVCVCDHPEDVPDVMTVMVGDHPVPDSASYAAGAAVLDAVRQVSPAVDLIALVSGGGSALCEAPRPGVPAGFISRVHRRLVTSGADIGDVNLVRGHLSAVKAGGVARAAGRPIDTFVLSDVGGDGPEVVASGPTIPGRHDPDAALAVLGKMAFDVPVPVAEAMRARVPGPPPPAVTVLADGRDAAQAVAAAAPEPARVADGWLRGDLDTCLREFLGAAGVGVTVGAGEVSLKVSGDGTGGRNTHAALLAAQHLGPGDLFCAFATDGVDGSSGAAGAIVDGSTILRGGDPETAIHGFDSARYLAATSDLLQCAPTGTNVADLWILWRRAAGPP
jgi:hydroxypyruvate reductase